MTPRCRIISQLIPTVVATLAFAGTCYAALPEVGAVAVESPTSDTRSPATAAEEATISVTAESEPLAFDANPLGGVTGGTARRITLSVTSSQPYALRIKIDSSRLGVSGDLDGGIDASVLRVMCIGSFDWQVLSDSPITVAEQVAVSGPETHSYAIEVDAYPEGRSDWTTEAGTYDAGLVFEVVPLPPISEPTIGQPLQQADPPPSNPTSPESRLPSDSATPSTPATGPIDWVEEPVPASSESTTTMYAASGETSTATATNEASGTNEESTKVSAADTEPNLGPSPGPSPGPNPGPDSLPPAIPLSDSEPSTLTCSAGEDGQATLLIGETEIQPTRSSLLPFDFSRCVLALMVDEDRIAEATFVREAGVHVCVLAPGTLPVGEHLLSVVAWPQGISGDFQRWDVCVLVGDG